MTVRKKITVRQLRKVGACDSQVELFKQTFGSEALLTMANIRKAIKAGLSLYWCYNLISYEHQNDYWQGEHSLPEREEHDRLAAEEARAEAVAWNSFRASENKYDYGSSGWLSARTRREKKLRKIAETYQPQIAAAKQAYDLAQGKLLLKYLRKV